MRIFQVVQNHRIISIYLIFSLFAGQVGLNLFNFSCYCKQEEKLSLLPHPTECGSTNLWNSNCCSSKESCSDKHQDQNHKSCGKSEAEYVKAELKADGQQESVLFFLALQECNDSYFIKLPLDELHPIFTFNLNESLTPHGRTLRILYSSFTC